MQEEHQFHERHWRTAHTKSGLDVWRAGWDLLVRPFGLVFSIVAIFQNELDFSRLFQSIIYVTVSNYLVPVCVCVNCETHEHTGNTPPNLRQSFIAQVLRAIMIIKQNSQKFDRAIAGQAAAKISRPELGDPTAVPFFARRAPFWPAQGFRREGLGLLGMNRLGFPPKEITRDGRFLRGVGRFRE